MIDERILKQLSCWIIRLLTIIFLVFLGLRYINDIINVLLSGISIISPLLIGIILALFLNIPLNLIEERLIKKDIKHKRVLSIALSLVLTLGFIVIIFVSIIPELIEAFNLILNIINQFDSTSLDLSNDLLNNIDLMDLKTTILNWFQLQSNSIMNRALSIFKNLTSVIITLFISLTFAIYLLSGKEKLKHQFDKFINVWIPDKVSSPLIYTAKIFNKTFQNYIVSQLTEACILGILCTIGMFILNIPYAGISGVLVGVTALIPYLGAFIGAGVSAVLIFAVNPFKSLLFIIYIVILQQIEGNIIYPKVVSSKLNLPSIWIFIAIVIGGNISGPIGMILSIPIIASLYTIIKDCTNKKYEVMHKGELV